MVGDEVGLGESGARLEDGLLKVRPGGRGREMKGDRAKKIKKKKKKKTKTKMNNEQ